MNMNKNNSMLEIAASILRKSAITMDIFTLFNEIAVIKEFTEEEKIDKLAQFHTYLTLDGKFVILTDGTWDLRDKHSFDAVNSLSTDFDIMDADLEMLEDEEEYDALEVTIVKEEEELIAETNSLKSLVGYDKVEEI